MARKDKKKKKGKVNEDEQKDDTVKRKAPAAEETESEDEDDSTDEEEETEETDSEEKDDEESEETEDDEEDEVEPVEEEKKPQGNEEAKPKKEKAVSHQDELSKQVGSLSSMMSDLVMGMTAMARRVERMETGGANEFRYHQKPEDVAKAAEGRVGVDERIVKIVDTILGEDFGVALERIDDASLGLLFTLNVPQRLSDIKEDMRPVMDKATGQQKVDERQQPVSEKYWPGDRRSRAVPTGSSFDLIREHCERVRAYIVATYQKTNRPTPEFRIKQ